MYVAIKSSRYERARQDDLLEEHNIKRVRLSLESETGSANRSVLKGLLAKELR